MAFLQAIHVFVFLISEKGTGIKWCAIFNESNIQLTWFYIYTNHVQFPILHLCNGITKTIAIKLGAFIQNL